MFYNLSEMNCIINFLLITLKNLDKTFLVKNQTKNFKINRPQRLRYMCIWVLYIVTSIHSVYLSFANLGTNIYGQYLWMEVLLSCKTPTGTVRQTSPPISIQKGLCNVRAVR